MKNKITRKAYAKINLSLDVRRRRPDGYHEVRMIMQTVNLFDELTFSLNEDPNAPRTTLEFKNIPLKADLGPVEKNLIYRASEMILDEYGLSTKVCISLSKNIPVAAGMAGGSTDAAAVFHGLNELLDLNMSIESMCRLGVKIGADVPFCIMGGTMLSEGIGEILSPVPTPPEAILLIVKPKISVSTKFVYENLHADSLSEHPDVDGMIKMLRDGCLDGMCDLLGNVLETVTVKEYPVIKSIKDVMKEDGARGALMSGSGPTVFGIWPNTKEGLEKAETAAESVRKKGLATQIFVTEFH